MHTKKGDDEKKTCPGCDGEGFVGNLRCPFCTRGPGW